MKSICLITCYMGPLPDYFGYYAATCKQNSTVRFVVINDTLEKSYTDGNIEYIRFDLDEVNEIASREIGETIRLVNSWKINELKPLFGRIFKERLKDVDFWGWCDLDIIWGDLRSFLTEEMLAKYDVITSKACWTAGHFTLLRNNELCNNLFSRNERITELLNADTYYAFEECCHRWDGIYRTLAGIADMNSYASMYDIVRNAEAGGELRAHFKDIIREHPQPVNYIYRQGKLKDLDTQEEFMYYHLITVKKIWRFYIQPYKPSGVIYMTPYGIRTGSESLVLWKIKRAVSCLSGIMKSVRKQKPAAVLKKLVRAN